MTEDGKPATGLEAEAEAEVKRLSLIGDLVKAGSRAHRRFHNVWVHDVSRRLYERRLVQAKADGVEKLLDKDEPFPVSDASTNISYNFGGLVGGVALAGGVAGAALWLAGVLGSANNPAQAIVPDINPPAVNMDDLDLKIRWWVEGDEGKSEVSEVD